MNILRMKLLKNFLLIFCIILVTFSLNSCSKNDLESETVKEPDGKENPVSARKEDKELADCPIIKNAELQKNFENEKNVPRKTPEKKCDKFSLFVDDAYESSDLKQLKNKWLAKDEEEIRIGYGGGRTFPVWFILRKNKDDISAVLVHPQLKNPDPTDETMKKDKLSKPKSGWKHLYNYLKNQKKFLEKEAVFENGCGLGLDTTSIVFENKSGSKYEFIAFHNHQKGLKKLIEISRRIACEFEVEEEFGFSNFKDK